MIIRKYKKGFTIIELLVVMAISVILMGLVLAPVVQSFQLTRRAQAMVDSQDAARTALQLISRELGQAMFVFDNAQTTIDTPYEEGLPASVGSTPVQTPIMLPVAQPTSSGGATTQWFVLPHAKIDFMLPKIIMHCNNPDHPDDKPRDYPRSGVFTEGTQKRTELYDWPECPYCKAATPTQKSDDVEARPKLPLQQDVTVVRYFLALRYNDLGPNNRSPLPNMGWMSPWGKNVVDGTENAVVLYRAEFNPYDNNLFPEEVTDVSARLSDPLFFYREGNGENGRPFRENWMNIVRVVGIGKYEDLVEGTRDENTGIVPSVEPTITFHNSSIENDTFTPAYASDKMNDYPTAPSTVFSATYGYWTPDSRVEVMRGDYWSVPKQGEDPAGVDFYTELLNGDRVVMKRVSQNGSWIITPEFNITQYEEDGFVPPDSAGNATTHREMAFTIDVDKGTVNFALQPPKQGGGRTGPVCWWWASMINNNFKMASNNDRGGAIREALLATLDLDNDSQYIKNARVVPGSEKIIGPDMTYGPSDSRFGQPVRYQRVPLQLGDPGINQYKIDYDTGRVYFSRDPHLDLPEKDSAGNYYRIQAYYLIYFNQSDDVVRGDYLTKSLINVHVGMRLFDPESGKPYPVDLSDSVKVRNALR